MTLTLIQQKKAHLAARQTEVNGTHAGEALHGQFE